MIKYELKHWMFANDGEVKDWMPAGVPGTVHTDLLMNKKIDEPFYSDNENKLAWICETGWVYKSEFDYPGELDKNKETYLIFEGLDTITTVYVNGKKVLNTSNMFLRYELDVSKYLKAVGNEIKIVFVSPLKYAGDEEKKYGRLPVALNSERVYIRKAQYSFGWDWGPSFPTSGIWRPVYLAQKAKAEIKDVCFETKSIGKKSADTTVKFTIEKNTKVKNIRYSVNIKNGNDVNEITGKAHDNKITANLNIKNPKLWYPAGEGEQSLYELVISLFDEENNLIDSVTKKVGIRKVELQLKEKKENTFRLIVNGKPVFAKGTNWIPSDSFLPRTTRDKYYTLLKKAKECNQNIIRVWGGGFYEEDAFYEICDELGLMVWHDFMFACGAYPTHKEIIGNIANEIEYNVRRLQFHPCIVVWCGNNENEWIWYQEYKSSYKNLPGYKIYAELIPSILTKEDPGRIYWESSPFGFDEDPNSVNSGTRHQWQIWSMWTDYREVKEDKSLFVTEFGFQGPANISTLEKHIPPEERTIQSRVFEFHNKQVEGNERLIRFLAGHLPLKTEWEDFLYLAQLNQGFALKTCLEHWRGNYPKTNGAIIWQLNDCWPVTSWSIIDSELMPKMSYHFVKNAFNDLFLRIKKVNEELYVDVNDFTRGNFKGYVSVKTYRSVTGKLVAESKEQFELSEKKNSFTHKIHYEGVTGELIVIASVFDEQNNMRGRNYFIGSEWKYMKLCKADIKPVIKKINRNKYEVKLRTDKPAYFVDVQIPGYELSDRGFILLPGEVKKIEAVANSGQEITAEEIKIYCLNDYC